MPFDNPYFPTQFDVGIINGPHTHIDRNGIDVTDGVGNHVKIVPNNPNPPFGVLPGILFNVAGQAATAGGILAEAAGVGSAGVASFYSVANSTGNGPSIELFATDGTTQNFVQIGNTSAQIKTLAKPAGGGAPGSVTLSATPLLTGAAKDVVWDGTTLRVPVSGGAFSFGTTNDGVQNGGWGISASTDASWTFSASWGSLQVISGRALGNMWGRCSFNGSFAAQVTLGFQSSDVGIPATGNESSTIGGAIIGTYMFRKTGTGAVTTGVLQVNNQFGNTEVTCVGLVTQPASGDEISIMVNYPVHYPA